MSFSRTASASASDEMSIDASADQYFIYAYGRDGFVNLRHHDPLDRGSVKINLLGNLCEGDVGDDTKLNAVKAHGILMILAWLVFAPSTVTLSRFGKVKFPGEDKIHNTFLHRLCPPPIFL